MGIGFEESVLHGIFGIFAIASDVHRQPENLALIAADQFLEGRHVAGLGRRNQLMLVFASNVRAKPVWIWCAQETSWAEDQPGSRCIALYVSTKHESTLAHSPVWMRQGGGGIQNVVSGCLPRWARVIERAASSHLRM